MKASLHLEIKVTQEDKFQIVFITIRNGCKNILKNESRGMGIDIYATEERREGLGLYFDHFCNNINISG